MIHGIFHAVSTHFHLPIPVHHGELARQFYVDIIGCAVGRSGEQWVDLSLLGHQMVCGDVRLCWFEWGQAHQAQGTMLLVRATGFHGRRCD
jgi:extradiol dioxygenase family protein